MGYARFSWLQGVAVAIQSLVDVLSKKETNNLIELCHIKKIKWPSYINPTFDLQHFGYGNCILTT